MFDFFLSSLNAFYHCTLFFSLPLSLLMHAWNIQRISFVITATKTKSARSLFFSFYSTKYKLRIPYNKRVKSFFSTSYDLNERRRKKQSNKAIAQYMHVHIEKGTNDRRKGKKHCSNTDHTRQMNTTALHMLIFELLLLCFFPVCVLISYT